MKYECWYYEDTSKDTCTVAKKVVDTLEEVKALQASVYLWEDYFEVED